MCAIDALGIPAMLDADVVISSTDPVTGSPVTVTTQEKVTTWEPESAMVFVGQRPGGGPGSHSVLRRTELPHRSASAHT